MILAVAAAWAAETADWHAAQARAFLKKGWTADAEAEVVAGLGLDAQHVELNGLCVDFARRRGDVDRAIRCAAAGAGADSGDLDARARLSQMELWLRSNFGWVDVTGPEGVASARIDLVSTSMQLDVELQTALADAAARLRAGVALPAHVALPIGDYTLLGLPVRVEAAQARSLVLPSDRFVAGAGAGKRLELSVGALGFSGHDFDNQRPGAGAELAFSLPVGALRVGIGATYELRAWTGLGVADAASPNTGGGVVRLALPLEVGSTLSVTPAAALRGAMLPGLEIACVPEPSPYACVPGRADETELPVYANGFGLVPQGELGVELHAGRFVFGLRGSVGHVFAFLPNPGEVVGADGRVTAWTSTPSELHGGVYGASGTLGVGL